MTSQSVPFAVDRWVAPVSAVGTVYHNIGIDPMTTTISDPTGRPQFLVDQRIPITELV